LRFEVEAELFKELKRTILLWTGNKSRDIFRKLARAAAKSEKKDWNRMVNKI